MVAKILSMYKFFDDSSFRAKIYSRFWPAVVVFYSLDRRVKVKPRPDTKTQDSRLETLELGPYIKK